MMVQTISSTLGNKREYLMRLICFGFLILFVLILDVAPVFGSVDNHYVPVPTDPVVANAITGAFTFYGVFVTNVAAGFTSVDYSWNNVPGGNVIIIAPAAGFMGAGTDLLANDGKSHLSPATGFTGTLVPGAAAGQVQVSFTYDGIIGTDIWGDYVYGPINEVKIVNIVRAPAGGGGGGSGGSGGSGKGGASMSIPGIMALTISLIVIGIWRLKKE